MQRCGTQPPGRWRFSTTGGFTMRRFALLVSVITFTLLGLMALSPTGSTLAQEATPAARLGAPDPSECTVEPRPMTFFEQFIGTPTAEQEAAMAAMEEATPDAGF